MTTSSTLIINRIELTRTNNNVLWMDILRIAAKHAPAETAMKLSQIRANDAEIANLVGLLEGTLLDGAVNAD